MKWLRHQMVNKMRKCVIEQKPRLSELYHHGNHDQSSHGRWASGSKSPTTMAELERALKKAEKPQPKLTGKAFEKKLTDSSEAEIRANVNAYGTMEGYEIATTYAYQDAVMISKSRHGNDTSKWNQKVKEEGLDLEVALLKRYEDAVEDEGRKRRASQLK